MRRVLACGLAFILLAGATQPVVPPTRPTAAQIARIKALTAKVGACHHQQAAAKAGTEADIDAIVGETLAACAPEAEALETQLAKYIGASAARQSISGHRGNWREAIRRIVAAARAGTATE